MRQVCFGRMDLGMGFLRPGRLWSLWGCSYGEVSENEPAGNPLLVRVTTRVTTARHSAEARPKEGWSQAWRQNVLFNSTTLSFQWGFLGSFLSWQKTDTQRQNGYKWPCSSCVVGRPYSHTETNAPSLRNEVCPGCVYSLGTDEEWVPGNLHSGSSQPGGRISDIHIPIHNGREITVMK